MTQPNVLPLALYQDVRLEQSDGAKLLGQCSLIQTNGNQPVREDGDCQPRSGRELEWMIWETDVNY